MSITSQIELLGMRSVSEAVSVTLRSMRAYAEPGMSTYELDQFGGELLKKFGARSAPKETYGFPGWTCISLNHEIAHGIPAKNKILQEGDLINIDVSAELNGYWGDNGCSFVLGNDIHQHQKLVDTSTRILKSAISKIKGGVRIADIGGFMEAEAKRSGYTVIKNLVGHGIGRSLHEAPLEIPNYYDRFNTQRFKKNSVVAIETFISTKDTIAQTAHDGWTLFSKRGFVAQHEHTIMITDNEPEILTEENGIF